MGDSQGRKPIERLPHPADLSWFLAVPLGAGAKILEQVQCLLLVVFILAASWGNSPTYPSSPFIYPPIHWLLLSSNLFLLLFAKLSFPVEKEYGLDLISGARGSQWTMSKYSRAYARCTKTQFHRIPIGHPSPFSYSYSYSYSYIQPPSLSDSHLFMETYWPVNFRQLLVCYYFKQEKS